MAAVRTITLTAATVATVTLDRGLAVEVINVTGTAAVWFRADGVDPTVAGDDCHVLPATVSAQVLSNPQGVSPVEVRLISSGTPQVTCRVVGRSGAA